MGLDWLNPTEVTEVSSSATTKNAIFISVTPSLFGSDHCRTDQLGCNLPARRQNLLDISPPDLRETLGHLV